MSREAIQAREIKQAFLNAYGAMHGAQLGSARSDEQLENIWSQHSNGELADKLFWAGRARLATTTYLKHDELAQQALRELENFLNKHPYPSLRKLAALADYKIMYEALLQHRKDIGDPINLSALASYDDPSAVVARYDLMWTVTYAAGELLDGRWPSFDFSLTSYGKYNKDLVDLLETIQRTGILLNDPLNNNDLSRRQSAIATLKRILNTPFLELDPRLRQEIQDYIDR